MIPGFPFGGMEHAGATFLREESVLFRSVPTAGDKIQRAALLLHETAHQWFGDLVAMRWFDDLWLRKASPCIWPTRY
jgi:aminopeptidase N